MTNDEFNHLSEEKQYEVARQAANRLFGKKAVDGTLDRILPIVRNMVGHGEPLELQHSDDPRDPRNNYWEGVWQVYEAE